MQKTKKTILVVTKSHDPTADYLFKKMLERGISFLRINVDTFPQEFALGCSINENGYHICLEDKYRIYDTTSLQVAFLRRKPSVKLESIKSAEARNFGEREYFLMIYWWLKSFGCKFLDTEEAIDSASNKLAQLDCARRVGLRIPKTLVTNEPQAAKNFCDTTIRTIAKTFGGHGAIKEKGFFTIFTNELGELLGKDFEGLKLGPAIFQERIEKKFELRVTAVKDKLFSCRIDSQMSECSKIDWRHYDFPNTPYSQFELPKEIKEKLFKIMAHFNIHFVAFDLAVTPDNEYVFFEMNPSPQWVWIEDLTGLPITDALIDVLTEKAPT